mmetsp:Transcript_8698/g.14747  ORF Transcript_8698/g.14747 Transcript_8698/m.14747 type:complete len:376 (-) Transcript_8698:904-2031(-)
MHLFQHLLRQHQIDIDAVLGAGAEKTGIAFGSTENQLINDFKFFWRDKGDMLSKQYTGTESTISKVSQDGKEGLWGKFNHKVTAVQRLLKNSIRENTDQEAIDIILGKQGQQGSSSLNLCSSQQMYLSRELRKQESLFTNLDFLKISVSSWNMGGVVPLSNYDLSQWLFPFKQGYLPDLIVVGLQEIVPLTAKNIVQNKNSAQVEFWERQIKNCLDENTEFHHESDKYVKIRQENMVGIFICIYSKRCLRPHIRDIATSRLKFGMGNFGNKGTCAIRLKYKDTTLSFASSHLESGQGGTLDQSRLNQLEQIIKTAFVKERGTNMAQFNWASHDIKVIFGDLNFRYVGLVEEEKLEKLIQQEDIASLVQYDEFTQF